MSHSRTTLNAPFYEWIDEVRRAFRKEKELLSKLEYYNVKFIGYKGINYGQIITNPMPSNDKDMLYWLDKIDEVERKIKINNSIIRDYEFFISNLSKVETIIINSLLFNYDISDKKHYRILNNAIRKFLKQKHLK
jgi:hypothetical protein